MGTRTALLFSIFVVIFFGTTAAELDCPKKLKDVCSESASPLNVTFSVFGFLGSGVMLLFPAWRLLCMFYGPEDIIGDRLFMFFLLIGATHYAAWVGFAFRECGYCDATPYVRGISIMGYVCNVIFSLIGVVGNKGRITGGNNLEFNYTFLGFGLFLCFETKNTEISLRPFVFLALVAQFCRVIATDYSKFSKIQRGVSITGAVSGFLCMRHPHLVAADPYWAVAGVAGIRLVECVFWFVAYLGFDSSPRRFFKYALDKIL